MPDAFPEDTSSHRIAHTASTSAPGDRTMFFRTLWALVTYTDTQIKVKTEPSKIEKNSLVFNSVTTYDIKVI